MKKIKLILVLMLTLVSSVCFFACGSKYKNLKINFESEYVQLFLDEEYKSDKAIELTDLSKTVINVKFSGIKAKNIGELDIQVIPADLAEIVATRLVGKELEIGVSAIRAGNGEIVVTHLGSNKSESVDLYVEKKAVSATGNGKKFVVDIPEAKKDESENLIEQFNLTTINSSELLTFAPFNATDRVSWEIVGQVEGVEILLNSGLADGIYSAESFISSQEEQEKEKTLDLTKPVYQIKISSNAVSQELKLKATLYMPELEIEEGASDRYEKFEVELPINLIIRNLIDSENLSAISNNALGSHQALNIEGFENYREIKDNLILIVNTANYNSSNLKFMFDGENVLNTYSDIYNFEFTTSTSQLITTIIEEAGDKTIKLTGLDQSANVEWVKIKFVPKNAIGNISEFEKIININLIESAENIAMSIDNAEYVLPEENDGINSSEITLLNAYVKNNNLGEKFNFRTHRLTTDASFSQLQIVVDETLLSVSNPVYKNGLKNYSNRTNQYLLRFYKGTSVLNFYQEDGQIVSEKFKATDNIYILYEKNVEGDGSNNLSFKVKNCYDGSLNDYSTDKNTNLYSRTKEIVINVNRSIGVSDMALVGSSIQKLSDGYQFGGNEDQTVYVLKDDLISFDDFNDNSYVYGLRVSDISSENEVEIDKNDLNSLVFKYSITHNGQEVDYFDIRLFTVSGTTASFKEQLVSNEIRVPLNSNELNFGLALFKRLDAPLGEYTITISQPESGFVSDKFSFKLVANVDVNNFIVSPFSNSDTLESKGYLYDSELKAWIIPVEDKLNFEILTGKESYQQVSENASWKSLTYYVKNGDNYSLIETKEAFETAKTNNSAYTMEFIEDSELKTSVKDVVVNIETVKADGVKDTNNMSYLTYKFDDSASMSFNGELSSGSYGSVYNGTKYISEVSVELFSKKYVRGTNGFYIEQANDNSAEKTIRIFVYIPVTTAYFENKTSTLNLYQPEKLGAYTNNYAQAELSLHLVNSYNDSQSVFDYVSWTDDGWLEDEDGLGFSAQYNGHTVKITLNKKDEGYNYRDNYRVGVTINQYGSKKVVACNIKVHDVKLTEKLIVRNALRVLDEEKYVYLKIGESFTFNVVQNGNPTFEGVKYVVCDTTGKVHKNYYITDDGVLKNSGEDGIKGNEDDESVVNASGDFKVIIFAKDWLRVPVESDLNSFNFSNFKEYLIDEDYNKQVQVVSVKVRDGSKATPYLLTTAEDVKALATGDNGYYYEIVNDINMSGTNPQIDVFTGNLSSYKEYILLDYKPTDWETNYKNYYTYSINNGYSQLTQSTAPAFVYNYYFELKQHSYTIYNLNLSSPFINYFAKFEQVNKDSENTEPIDFASNKSKYYTLDSNQKYQRVSDGAIWNQKTTYYTIVDASEGDICQISDIEFKVSFIGAESQNLGLIGLNIYSLHNVSVEIGGSLTIKENNTISSYNFGGLVAENYGNISYSDKSITGVSGDIEIKKDAKVKVNVGGLVGVNYAGNIQGSFEASELETEASYGLFYDDQSATYVGTIKLSNIDNADIDSEDNSTLGGIVGLNNKGIISYVYVAGEINGLNNVGGIIGYNAQGVGQNKFIDVSTLDDESLKTTINDNSAIISLIMHSQVSAKVKGNECVGGLTGKDEYGVYYHSYYEVYNQQKTVAIKGENNVGGLIGYTFLGGLKYCYFHSFKWDYGYTGSENTTDSNENGITDEIEAGINQFKNGVIDIQGNSYVGGLIGYANSYSDSEHVKIYNSLVDAFISGSILTSSVVGRYKAYITIQNGYVQGYLENKASEEYSITKSTTSTETSEVSNFYSYILAKKKVEIDNDLTTDEYIYGLHDDYNDIKESLSDISIWGKDDTINNGRHYLLYKDGSLVTLAPTSISIDQNTFKTDNDRVLTKFYDEYGDEITPSEATVVLYLYDLIDNKSANYTHDKRIINLLSLDDIIDRTKIKITPESVKSARVRVESSNANIVTVLNDGKILLKAEGVCELSFISVIDERVSTTIKVVVAKMPEGYEIYKNATLNEFDNLNNSYVNIIKDESKFIYENYTGDKVVNGQTYNYTLSNQTSLWITNSDGEENDIDNDGMVSVNNSSFETDESVVKIENREPLVFSVNKDATPHEYTISLSPYLYYEVGETSYYLRITEFDDAENKNIDIVRTFKINTRKGVENIATNITNAVMSVADELSLEISLTTDETIESLDMSVEIFDENGNATSCVNENGDEIENLDVFKFIDNATNQLNNGKLTLKNSVDNRDSQTEEFIISLNQDVKISKDLFAKIKFSYLQVDHEIEIALIPQDISSIISINYKQETANKWNSSSVIRPGTPNMIVINVAPDNAYYEYLEITDVTLNEKISFIQFDKFNPEQAGLTGSALSKLDESSSDGYGIKLKKQFATDGTLLPMYVYTLLDALATRNMDHTIRVTAYSSTGYELGTSLITLKAVLYPRVELSYINAIGVETVTADSAKTLDNNVETDLAIGVEAKLKVETFTTDALSWEVSYLDENGELITGDNLTNLDIYNTEPTLKNNGYYYLTLKDNISSLDIADYYTKVKAIKLSAIVTKYTNSVAETSEASLTFNLKQMTLNNVSAKTNRATSNNRLGGVIGDELQLEFYFAPTDISYYENNTYWKTPYLLDSVQDKNIKTLLTTLNSVGEGVNLYLQLPNGEKVDLEFNEISDSDSSDGEIDIAYAEYKSSNKETYLTITKYKLDEDGDGKADKIDSDNDGVSDYEIIRLKIKVHNNYINQCMLGIKLDYYYDDSGIAKIGKHETDSRNKNLDVTFGFNFASVSTLYDYIPVNSAIDFMNMVQGGYYILTSDITLSNYNMLDLSLGGFDGNGHTITIKSYDYETMASTATNQIGYFGLFKQIYADEIIKNVTLNYELKNDYNIDLCEYEITEGVYYSSIYFGGISPTNNGIITNCLITGEIGVSATKLAPANFRLAGITCTNVGYITNTSIQIDLYGGALVAGAVVENSGKISSSNFTGNILAYSSSSLSTQIQTAGFALTNQGEIAYCFVGDLTAESSKKLGSAGSIGGFALTNSGVIKDCYLAHIEFDSRGEVGGFVHTSTGTIERCYVNADSSLIGARQNDLFALNKDSGTFANCYFITETYTEYKSDKDISCITNFNKQASFKNYVFTTDDFGVWKMTSNGPILSCSYTLIKTKSSHTVEENGEEKVKYIVSGTKEIPYLIYNAETYQYYMAQHENETLYGYYRLVADINLDVEILKDKPVSSSYSFSGQLEGNNMAIQNFGLYPDEKSNTSGLFKEIKQLSQETSFVNNLILQPKTIRSSNASMVGALAGIIDGGFVYNVTIDSQGVTVLGKNAVGGLAGIIKGNFRINGISSNVGANASFRQTIGSKLNIYTGKIQTNSVTSNNISVVSYAGAIAGIVEGYNNMVNSAVSIYNYSRITNFFVSGDITVIGEVVGGMFGFVSEQTYAENLTFEAGSSAVLKGVYYTGGLVGENRGVITNATVKADENKLDLFFSETETKFSLVSGGIVAVNYGGLIHNSTNYANVVSNYHLATVGGIAGRNSHGTIAGCKNLGGLYGLFTGGIVGADYDFTTMNKSGNATGSVTDATRYALPTENKDYTSLDLTVGEEHLTTQAYQGVTIENLNNWFEKQISFMEKLNKSLESFYQVQKGTTETETNVKTNRVLGAIVGVTDKDIVYSYDSDSARLVISIDSNNNGWDNLDPQLVNQITAGGELYSNSDIYNPEAEKDDQYTKLQQYLYVNEEVLHYYFVAVTNASYDFWNLNNGYSTGYAKIYTK